SATYTLSLHDALPIFYAVRAIPRPATNDWLLQDVRIYDADMNFVRRLPELAAMHGVTPAQLTLAKVDPAELNYWTLKKRIAELRSEEHTSELQSRSDL